MAEQQNQQASLGQCGWCENAATTRILLNPRGRRKQPVPVCDAHARRFLDQGAETLESVQEKKRESERKRKQFLANRGRR